MLWEDRRRHLYQRAIESSLVELISKLGVKAFTGQRKGEKNVQTEGTTYWKIKEQGGVFGNCK